MKDEDRLTEVERFELKWKADVWIMREEIRSLRMRFWSLLALVTFLEWLHR